MNARRKRAGGAEASDSLEARIRTFAATGKLKIAAKAAIKSQLQANLPVVYLTGNRIVREHPDGTRETLRVVDDSSRPVPARYRSFVVKKTPSRPK